MRKKLWKIWQTFLILSIPGSIISLFVMACCLDSESHIPAVIMAINILWLLLLSTANSDIGAEKKKKEKEKDDEISVA